MATWCGSGPGEAVTFKNLDYVVRDRVAEITLARAPVNAIDHGLIEDLNDAYRQAKADNGRARGHPDQRLHARLLGRHGPRDDPRQARPRPPALPAEALLRDARPAVPHGQADHRGAHRAGACGGRDARRLVRLHRRRRHREPRLSGDPGRRDPGDALRPPAAPDRPPQGVRAAVLRQAGIARPRPSAWAWSTRSCRRRR